MDMEADAKEAAILLLMDGWHSQRATHGVIDTYLIAVRDCSAEAVRNAAQDFLDGTLDRDHSYRPSAADLAKRATLWHQAIDFRTRREAREIEQASRVTRYKIGAKPPEGFSPLGPTRVDFGSRNLNLEGMTHAQKEAVINSGGLLPSPGGKAALGVPMPQLKRMA